MKKTRLGRKGVAAIDFGQALRGIREKKNISQHYVAFRLGISQNAYSKVELNRAALSLSRALELANILDVNIDEIICGGLKNINPASTI